MEIVDHDIPAFRTAMGLAPEDEIPKAVCEAYEKFKPGWDRLASGAQIPSPTIALICMFAGGMKKEAEPEPEKIIWKDVRPDDLFIVRFKDEEYQAKFIELAGKSEKGKVRFLLADDPDGMKYREIPKKDVVGKVW